VKGLTPPAQAEAPAAPAGAIARALGWLVAAGTVLGLAVAASALTAPTHAGWTAMILGALALWAGWLYWRSRLGSGSVPGHVVQLALAVPVLVLLGHLLAGARVNPVTHRINVLADQDTTLLVQLMTLGLMVLLVQDVLSRVRQPRWVLTAVGLAAAVGSVLRLYASATPAVPAVAMSGYAGVGIMLAPCWLPATGPDRPPGNLVARLLKVELVLRVALAALLVGLLTVRDAASAAAALQAALIVGASLLLSGLLLGRYRPALLGAGALLVLGGLAGLRRLGGQAPGWPGEIGLLGVGQPLRSAPAAGLPGLKVLAMAAGWVGLAAVAVGVVAAITWELFRSRRSAPGDQARSALWAAVAALGGAALAARGGLAVPAAGAVAAVAWGLMPHVMAHPVRRFTGWVVTAAFLAVLAVLGLEQRLAGSPWIRPLLREGDDALHAGGAFLLAAVLFWRVGRGRWWQAVAAAAGAGMLAGLGELAQKYLSTRRGQWSDVGWDFVGAGVALAVLAILAALERLAKKLARLSGAHADGW
jgi:VanZ family protein